MGYFYSVFSLANCKANGHIFDPNTDVAWRDIRILADDKMQGRETASAGSQLARDYIQHRFKQIGLLNFESLGDYRQHFNRKKWNTSISGINLVGWLEGSQFPDKYIVITAHYDHVGMKGPRIFNGADDNASGVAAMLYIAENLTILRPRYSVVFLATDAEELGLYGAYAFIQNPPIPLQNIRFNLNLDMMAQGGSRQRLYVYGAGKHTLFKPLVSELKARSLVCVKSGRPGYFKGFSGVARINWLKASDHGAFDKAKIPFLFLGVGEHRYYHTEHDTVDVIDQAFFRRAVMTSLQAFSAMDKL